MSAGKDYYQILGVSKSAGPDEIKQAYRKLAREHHPDMVKDGDKAQAERRFKEINEAYQVLSNPEKRKMYDQFGSAAFGGGFPGGGAGAGAAGASGWPFGFGGQGARQGQWGPFTYTYTSDGGQSFGGNNGMGADFDPFDVFEQFFGFRGFGGGGGRSGPRKGKNLYYEMRISFAESVFGLEKKLKVESGEVTVKIPAGIRNGMELRFTGKGMPGQQGAPSGDLFITIGVESPREFTVYDDNILVRIEIDFVRAILGGVVEIPVVDPASKSGIGYTKLKIPEGTQFGTKLLVRGKGMPRLRGRGQGDAVVEVLVKMPRKVNRRQRELLEELSRPL